MVRECLKESHRLKHLNDISLFGQPLLCFVKSLFLFPSLLIAASNSVKWDSLEKRNLLSLVMLLLGRVIVKSSNKVLIEVVCVK